MVIHPVCRQGLEMEALAKQTLCAPGALNLDVSLIGPAMYCR